MAKTHSGEKTTPPMLAPLYAMPSAAGRIRTNQGETMPLIAAALVAPHPAPVSRLAAKNCHGAALTAQPTRPPARHSAAILVARAVPRRR